MKIPDKFIYTPIQIIPLVVGVLLALPIILTIVGFSKFGFIESLPWISTQEFYKFIISFLVIFLLFFLFYYLKKVPSIIACFFAITFISIITNHVFPLLSAIFFSSSSVSLGDYLLKKFRLLDEAKSISNRFLVGAAFFGVFTSLISHLPINYPGIYGVFLALPLLACKGRVVKQLVSTINFNQFSNENISYLVINALLSAFAVIHFIYALFPELNFDALALHLLVPTHMFQRQEWGFDPDLYAMALIPMLGDWIFSIGYMLSGETGARVVNLLFSYLLAYQGYELSKWLGASNKASILTALLFLSTPLALIQTGSLHVEAIWSAYVVGGVMAFMKFWNAKFDNAQKQLPFSAFLLGVAANAKAITFPIVLVLSVYFIAKPRKLLLKDGVRSAMVAAVLFLLIGSNPYLSAYLISGNPVLPFFNETFKSEYFPAVNFTNTLYHTGLTWDALYRITFETSHYLEATVGAPGYQWLLLLPASLFFSIYTRDWKSFSIFLFSVASIYIIFNSQSYLRYIFPFSILLAVFINVGIFKYSSKIKGIIILPYFSLALSLFLNLVFFTSGNWAYRSFPIQILFSNAIKQEYLYEREPVRLAIDIINSHNIRHTPVAFLTERTFGAGLTADALYPHWYNNRFSTAINNALTTNDFVDILKSYGAEYVILDDRWGSPQKRDIIKSMTDELAYIKDISVRRLKQNYIFTKELIQNGDLYTSNGWTIAPGALVSDGVAIVSGEDPITQSVHVSQSQLYKNSIVAKCTQVPTKGRVQLNWHDENGEFINASIKLFDCTDEWQVYSMDVVAPLGASSAVVYGASQTNTPIQISKISLY